MRMARVLASEAVPWMAPALFAARLVVTEQLPYIAAVDRAMRVYVSRAAISSILHNEGLKKALSGLAFVWVHEIWHVLRDHAGRMPASGSPVRWNVACDMEIDDWLPDGLTCPKQRAPILPKHFGLPDGKPAEWYYVHLPDETDTPSTGDASSGEESTNAPSGNGAGASAPDEGSGVHNQPRPWEMGSGANGEAEANGLTPLEVEQVRLLVARTLLSEKSRGDMPAGWVRWAKMLFEPVVDWRTILLRRVRGAIVDGIGNRIDYSYRRPHRRGSVLYPLLLPSLQGDYLPRVACVVDTSGSISDHELGQALAEVRGVLEQLRAPVTVIPCDAVPYEAVQVMHRQDWVQLGGAMKGGGGTDMVAGIEAALRLQPPVDAVVVLTDGYTPYPEHAYEVPVVFVLWKPGSDDPPKPPMPPWRQRDVVVVPLAQEKRRAR